MNLKNIGIKEIKYNDDIIIELNDIKLFNKIHFNLFRFSPIINSGKIKIENLRLNMLKDLSRKLKIYYLNNNIIKEKGENRCEWKKKNGERCKNKNHKNTNLCLLHLVNKVKKENI
jgi:hypothetical protein